MKTGLDVIRDIHTRLLTIKSDLNGGDCWEIAMGDEVTGVNIVTNILGLDDQSMQFAIVLINIHAANVVNDLPNLQALNPVIDKVTNLFNPHWGSDYHVDILQHAQIRQDTNKQWYANIRLNYYAVQKNKSI